MKTSENLKVIRFADRILKILIYLSFLIALTGVLVVFYSLSKNETGFYFALDIPYSFNIEPESGLFLKEDGSSKIGITQATGKVNYENPPVWYVLLFVLGINLLKMAFFILVLVIMRKITSSILQKKEFRSENAIWIRKSGWLFILYSVIIFLYQWVSSSWMGGQINTSFKEIVVFDIGIEYIIPGIFLLALATIFEKGKQLDEEVKLTI